MRVFYDEIGSWRIRAEYRLIIDKKRVKIVENIRFEG